MHTNHNEHFRKKLTIGWCYTSAVPMNLMTTICLSDTQHFRIEWILMTFVVWVCVRVCVCLVFVIAALHYLHVKISKYYIWEWEIMAFLSYIQHKIIYSNTFQIEMIEEWNVSSSTCQQLIVGIQTITIKYLSVLFRLKYFLALNWLLNQKPQKINEIVIRHSIYKWPAFICCPKAVCGFSFNKLNSNISIAVVICHLDILNN